MALFTKNPPVSPWWRIAHAASDKSALSIRQGFSRAANAIEVDAKLLNAEIKRGRYARAADAFDWKGFEGNLAKELESRTMKAAERSAKATAKRLGIKPPSLDSMRATVRARAKATAKQMAKESRTALKESMRRLREQLGRSSAQTASRARQLAGLNRKQASSVVTRLSSLIDEGASPRKRDVATRKLIKGHRRNRSTLVARHEGLTAAEDAQEAAILAAESEGMITGVTQRWVSIRDKRRDPVCARLHGQKVPIGKAFKDPLTGITYMKPPQPHGLCRCGRQYSFRQTAKAKAARELRMDPGLTSISLAFQDASAAGGLARVVMGE